MRRSLRRKLLPITTKININSAPKDSDQQEQISAAGDSNSNPSETRLEERDRYVERSFEYVREGRAAIRLLHRGDVDRQGARVDRVRGELEEILSGLGEEQMR